MAIFYKNIIRNLVGLIPLILLYYLCLSNTESQMILFGNFFVNLKYIIIFYWTLRNPSIIGYGHIFLAGILSDVVNGLPMGTSSICFLIMVAIAAYIRNMTVRISLWSDWIVFVPTVFITNLVFFILISYYSNIGIDYIELFFGSIVTILFYPLIWILFIFLTKYINIRGEVA